MHSCVFNDYTKMFRLNVKSKKATMCNKSTIIKKIALDFYLFYNRYTYQGKRPSKVWKYLGRVEVMVVG